MAKAKKPPRETWDAKRDRLSGIVRDPQTGIVLSRTSRHPQADLFMSAPMGKGLPGLNLNPFAEISQILAIHIFDNLDCSPPREPLYKFRHNKQQAISTGLPGALWVPINAPDDDYEPVAESVEIADVTSYSDQQLAALKAHIDEVETRNKLVANLDPHVREGGMS